MTQKRIKKPNDYSYVGSVVNCIVCGESIRAGGLGSHVRLHKKRSDQLKIVMDKIMNRVFFSPDGCWYWLGSLRIEYGAINTNIIKERHTHRASYTVFKGNIPKGKWVLHTCDNKLCVNPDHLYLGDRDQNTIDSIERGLIPHGEKHVRAKLTSDQVIEIRKRIVSGEMQSMIAKDYGIDKGTVSAINCRKSWAHLK